MAPLLISGIASLASSAIDAWSNVAQRKIAIEQTKFDNAFSKAMGVAQAAPRPQSGTVAQGLENQLRNAPEIRGILEAQDPSRPTSLQVSAEGRVWMQTAGNAPTELTVSLETRELARQLNSALNVTAPVRTLSSMQPSTGSLTTLTH
ncbi:MAG: hypothetical protein WCF18_24695 [Chthoniobacteraceae bacterium]